MWNTALTTTGIFKKSLWENNMSLLSTKDLYFSYSKGEQAVLADINIAFEKGKLYALVGQSGSGKSTLLSILSGLLKPSQGCVLYAGIELTAESILSYRQGVIGLISQNILLYPLLTVAENVVYPQVLKGVKSGPAKERASDLLLELGIAKEKHKKLPGQLSGGEQQRVAIARCLAKEAEIIIADEPTGNLDAENSYSVLEIMLKLAREQDKLIIVATHDPLVTELADVVYKLEDINAKAQKQISRVE